MHSRNKDDETCSSEELVATDIKHGTEQFGVVYEALIYRGWQLACYHGQTSKERHDKNHVICKQLKQPFLCGVKNIQPTTTIYS